MINQQNSPVFPTLGSEELSDKTPKILDQNDLEDFYSMLSDAEDANRKGYVKISHCGSLTLKTKNLLFRISSSICMFQDEYDEDVKYLYLPEGPCSQSDWTAYFSLKKEKERCVIYFQDGREYHQVRKFFLVASGTVITGTSDSSYEATVALRFDETLCQRIICDTEISLPLVRTFDWFLKNWSLPTSKDI